MFSFIFLGVIDAAVNGGLAKYQEAFFRSSPISQSSIENSADKVALLQTLMSEQLTILEQRHPQLRKVLDIDITQLDKIDTDIMIEARKLARRKKYKKTIAFNVVQRWIDPRRRGRPIARANA